jgi:hypothetical protein
MRRPERVTIIIKEAGDHDAARAAFSELYGSLEKVGVDVSMLLQESSDLPPLVLYIGLPLLGKGMVKLVAQVLIAWINRNRTTVRATSIDGFEVSIEASEEFVPDLLLRKSNDPGMTPKEREIAVAAMELSAPTHLELLQKIFERTKVNADEVHNTLNKLCDEMVLDQWADPPARNVAAGDPPRRPPKLWYGKGPKWTDT